MCIWNSHRHDKSMKILKTVKEHWAYKTFLDKAEVEGNRVLDFRRRMGVYR